jgi:hypothetical protein
MSALPLKADIASAIRMSALGQEATYGRAANILGKCEQTLGASMPSASNESDQYLATTGVGFCELNL